MMITASEKIAILHSKLLNCQRVTVFVVSHPNFEFEHFRVCFFWIPMIGSSSNDAQQLEIDQPIGFTKDCEMGTVVLMDCDGVYRNKTLTLTRIPSGNQTWLENPLRMESRRFQ